MRSGISLVIILLCLCLVSCKKKKKSILLDSEAAILSYAEILKDEDLVESDLDCRDPLSYAPLPELPNMLPLKIIRLNVHFMNSVDQSQNVNWPEGIAFAEKMVAEANRRLGLNEKMNLPIGNDTQVLDPNYRYEIHRDDNSKEDLGIYFHYDDDLYYFINKGANRNNYKKDVIKKYGINTDSIINVFLMPHHPDSVASPTYSAFGSGIALGNSIKLGRVFDEDIKAGDLAANLNHEVGHVMGLQHAWLKHDGCEDTPVHPNCYNTTSEPPCNEGHSNNMMDYNWAQIALTPCQIGKIHKNIARETSRQRKLVLDTWCDYDKDMSVIVDGDYHWFGTKELEGDLIIKKGSELIISCKLSMPVGSKIVVEPGATLILDACEIFNSCENEWLGIEVQSTKKQSAKVLKRGVVRINNLVHVLEQDKA